MQQRLPSTAGSACPHDCPSACALEVEVRPDGRIGRIKGARHNSYTLGVVCAKVARYSERIDHPDRLLYPLRRTGPKGAGQFQRISWDAALAEIAERFSAVARRSGAEAVWPYHSGGNMGVLQRYGLDRLRNPMRYSRQHTTICVTPAESGWLAGVGKLLGPDPREMQDADLIVEPHLLVTLLAPRRGGWLQADWAGVFLEKIAEGSRSGTLPSTRTPMSTAIATPPKSTWL